MSSKPTLNLKRSSAGTFAREASARPSGEAVLLAGAATELLESAGKLLSMLGFSVVTAVEVEDALYALHSHAPDLLVLDGTARGPAMRAIAERLGPQLLHDRIPVV